jgi:hypothetical protein
MVDRVVTVAWAPATLARSMTEISRARFMGLSSIEHHERQESLGASTTIYGTAQARYRAESQGITAI